MFGKYPFIEKKVASVPFFFLSNFSSRHEFEVWPSPLQHKFPCSRQKRHFHGSSRMCREIFEWDKIYEFSLFLLHVESKSSKFDSRKYFLKICLIRKEGKRWNMWAPPWTSLKFTHKGFCGPSFLLWKIFSITFFFESLDISIPMIWLGETIQAYLDWRKFFSLLWYFKKF